MELHTNYASPFCRKIDVILRETGLHDRARDVTAVGHPTDSSNMPLGANPLGKIPVLIRNDGPAIYDSRVISRFLDSMAGAGLYPESRLWDVLTLEATGDGIAEAAVLMVYETRSRPEENRYVPWVEGQWAKIDRALDMLGERWMGLLSGPLNAGQISIGCALGYLDFRHGARNWRLGRNALAGWYSEFSQRTAMQETIPRA